MHRAYLPFLSLVLAALFVTGCPRPQPTPLATVPNLTGNTRTEAEGELLAARLALGLITEAFSATVPQGQIISQNPAAAARVTRGSAVNVEVSLGPLANGVPNVVGLTREGAEAALIAAGFQLGAVTQAPNATVPVGQIISQNPATGAQSAPGTSVDIVISLGAGTIEVPNVIGNSQVDASQAILTRGLAVGNVTEQLSCTVFNGNVITQDPLPDAQVATGTEVDLVLSRQGATLPDVTNKTEQIATVDLTSMGLTVGAVTQENHPTVLNGQVISSNPAAGTCVEAGSAVDLVISLGPPPVNISSFEDLEKIGNDPGFPLRGNYNLTANIDAGKSARKGNGAGFDPIGANETPFTGTFFGNSFTISNLVINRPSLNGVGLFGAVGVSGDDTRKAIIRNLNVSGGSITGGEGTGALCGMAINAEFTDCHASVPVTGFRMVGGLIGGVASETSADSCSASGTVFSTTLGDPGLTDDTGGLVGNSSGLLVSCSAEGAVSGEHSDATGGLVGRNTGRILQCTSSGEVVGRWIWVGGLVGLNQKTTLDETQSGYIADCTSSSPTTGFSFTGGLTGNNMGGLITRCRATGTVRAEAGAGGLVGVNGEANVTLCVAEGDVIVTSATTGSGDYAGGLIGLVTSVVESPTEISDSCAFGSVSGRLFVGGLIGSAQLSNSATPPNPITRCYAVGDVNGEDESGGLLGRTVFGTSPVTASFWNTESTGLLTSVGGGTGLATAAMMQASTFTTAGWDFTSTWGIEEGTSYPFLLWTAD